MENPVVTKTKIHINKMSDEELLALCQKYGTQAILWKRKFIGLLPEVDRRKLYEKKNCVSIYEFAAKFGGVTKKHTQRVIQVDKAFTEKGVNLLREMLQEGAASINKLAKIVSIIGVIDEEELVVAIKKLSCRSLETYVRDLRRAQESGHTKAERRYLREHNQKGCLLNDGTQIENGLFEPLVDRKSVHVNTFADVGTVALKKLQLNLSKSVLDGLLQLQGKGIDALLKEFLRNREEEIVRKKKAVAIEVAESEEKRREEGKEQSRYISVKTKRILNEEYGTKCSLNDCGREAVHIHHTVPFALSRSNDPNLLRPLCKEHHDILHSVSIAYLGMKFRN